MELTSIDQVITEINQGTILISDIPRVDVRLGRYRNYLLREMFEETMHMAVCEKHGFTKKMALFCLYAPYKKDGKLKVNIFPMYKDLSMDKQKWYDLTMDEFRDYVEDVFGSGQNHDWRISNALIVPSHYGIGVEYSEFLTEYTAEKIRGRVDQVSWYDQPCQGTIRTAI